MKTCRCKAEHDNAGKLCDECLARRRKYRDSPKGKEWSQSYYIRNKERIKATSLKNHFKRTYGITQEEYETRVAAQGGLCAICGEPPLGRYRLCVDHNHTTGKVRELLCNGCNATLGYSKESETRLLSAIAYLRKHVS